MRRLLPLWLLPCLLLSTPLRAMEFASTPLRDGVTLILAHGPIRPGDETRFLNLASGLGQRSWLMVDSPGGNVLAADRMRALVAGFGMTVIVPSDGECASACFLLFAAARSRLVQRGGRVGVHSASLPRGETMDTLAMTTLLARLVAEYEVPQSIIGRMVTTEPHRIWWLSEEDLLSIRNTRVLEEAPDGMPRRPAPSPPPAPDAGVPQAGAPAPRTASIAAPARPPAGSGAFAQGRADWAVLQDWVQGQSGSLRAGIESWVRRRSLRNPGGCESADPDFARGCQEARRRFTPIDARRLSDPDYRRGFSPG